MTRLWGERIATSLRYGLVDPQRRGRDLLGAGLVELLEVLVVVGGHARTLVRGHAPRPMKRRRSRP